MLDGMQIGRVTAAVNDALEVTLPLAYVGQGVRIRPRGMPSVPAIVTRIDERRVRLAAFAPLAGIAVGDIVESDASANILELGTPYLGCAIDAAGRPLSGVLPLRGRRTSVIPEAIGVGERRAVDTPFWTGIRSVDGLLTIGRGARVGIFGAPGAGKSTLMEMLMRGAQADAVVVALIGERGREAAHWMERIARHTTLVVVPSDRSAAERIRGAHVALAQASQLRRRGLRVLVILDSLARFCSAARELALANGEAAGRGGYPPSVFNEMARLLERGGNFQTGSITLIATVLSDGADEREPLSDAARAALDGHIVLSSDLARAGRFPAIDVLASASRTMHDVVAPEHRRAADRVRATLAILARTQDARELGLATMTAELERAVAAGESIDAFLRQDAEPSGSRETLAALAALAGE